MAKEVVTRLIDDLDGGPADETVRFELDGTAYEIDLSHHNAERLRRTLALYVEKGSTVAKPATRHVVPGGRTSARGRKPAGQRSPNPEENRAVREWAARKGISVHPRGRIPREVVAAFYADAPAAKAGTHPSEQATSSAPQAQFQVPETA